MSGDANNFLTTFRAFRQESNPDATPQLQEEPLIKKKRNLPGTPDPDVEVIALSPKSLMATNRFVCEVCNKGFQRDQNLQLHRRGHNLPWKLKQRSSKEAKKRVYICPEKSCVHHVAARALGDLTGIKKHYSRKHGEKRWKCERCSKKYAVRSDWKAHSKTCGTREYKCDCGTLFSRKDSFITHRAFCDALAEEGARLSSSVSSTNINFKSNPQNSDPSLMVASPSSPSRTSMLQRSVPQFCPISQSGFVGDNAAVDSWVGGHLGQGNHQKTTVSQSFYQTSTMDSRSMNPQSGFSVDASTKQESTGLATSPVARNRSCPPVVRSALAGNVFRAPALTEYGEFFSNSLLKSSGSLKDERVIKGPLNGFSSLYMSSSHQSQKTVLNYSSHMSATALLQKAAQMGATTSNPSVLRSIRESSRDAPGTATPRIENADGLQLFGHSKQCPQNFQEHVNSLPTATGNGVFPDSKANAMDSSPNSTNGLVGVMISSDGSSKRSAERNNNCNMDHLIANEQMRFQRVQHQYESNRELTRDFLGVGDPRGVSSQQKFADFASIHSDLALSNYSGSH